MKSPQLQKIALGITINPGVLTLARIAKAIGSNLVNLVDDGLGETEQYQVLMSPPGKHLFSPNTAMPSGGQAQPVLSSSGEDGKGGALSREEIAAVLHAMQETTALLRIAIDHTTAAASKTVEDAGRSAPNPRPRVAPKRARAGKNRKKVSGAA